MKPQPQPFPAALAAARKAAGLTQAALAERIGRPQSWVGNAEGGRWASPQGETLKALAAALGGRWEITGSGYLFRPG